MIFFYNLKNTKYYTFIYSFKSNIKFIAQPYIEYALDEEIDDINEIDFYICKLIID